MFVVEFHFGSPVLQAALAQVPGMEVTYEEIYHSSDGIMTMFWASGDDFDDLEAAIEDDPTVTNPVCLTEADGRRLYRVTYTDRGEAVATYPEWGELDISFIDATGTHEGWTVRMRMPDRETLAAFREVCAERDVGFELLSIYEVKSEASESDAELTTPQREALLTARELGYFDIPRDASLAEVADECGVSPQAASERLRRGTATLVDTAITGEGE